VTEQWQARVGQRVVVRHRLPDGSATDVVGELLRADDGVLVVAGRQGEVSVAVADVVAGKVVPPRPTRPAPPHLALSVDDLERVMSGHWLPPDHEHLGDWLLRAAGGFTNRGNSVLVTGSPGLPAAEAVERVSAWYTARGLPPRAAVPDTAGRASPLTAAGWLPGLSAVVLTARTSALTAPGSTAPPDLPAGLTLDLADRPDAAWQRLYRYRGQELPPGAVELLMSAPEQAFASVRVSAGPDVSTDVSTHASTGGHTVAVGRGSLAHAWLGVTAVEVAHDHRRRGLARAVLAALAAWGAARGARSTYLQVAEGNEAALALYLSAGFTVHHRYDYLSPAPR
jgi:GNAT superfamily N-acetyltransferase